jgi:serine/threonine protein phosphatase 1
MPNSPRRLIYYAIGDIHGEAERLKAMYDAIVDHHSARFLGRNACIVHLGDYVDRGPDSCGVVDAVMAMEAHAAKQKDLTVVSLMGNHERMMLNGLGSEPVDRRFWMQNGGVETIASYEKAGRGEADLKHLAWMKKLPLIWRDKAAGLIFVHAGVSPDDFPKESEKVYLWTRSAAFFDPSCWTSPALEGQVIIHGHTPTENDEPDVAGGGKRINVDTGAVFGGPLTAAVLAPGEKVTFLTV